MGRMDHNLDPSICGGLCPASLVRGGDEDRLTSRLGMGDERGKGDAHTALGCQGPDGRCEGAVVQNCEPSTRHGDSVEQDEPNRRVGLDRVKRLRQSTGSRLEQRRNEAKVHRGRHLGI
jgi:hypothetical protein